MPKKLYNLFFLSLTPLPSLTSNINQWVENLKRKRKNTLVYFPGIRFFFSFKRLHNTLEVPKGKRQNETV